MSKPATEIIRSARTAVRLDAAACWLEAIPPGDEVLILAPNWDSADDLVRRLAIKRGSVFGIHRLTLSRLLGLLAEPALAAANLAPASSLTVSAVVARAVYFLRSSGKLSSFEPICDRPGFAAAVARTMEELRLGGVGANEVSRIERVGAALAAMLSQFEEELAQARIADRAALIKLAIDAARDQPPPRFVGIPILILDLPISSAAERDFLGAIASRAPSVLATIPAGDPRSDRFLRSALRAELADRPQSIEQTDSLNRLQAHLFESSAPPHRKLDDSVTMLSAPGEARECVEIARRIQEEARAGVAFDRIAVVLHRPELYTAHLEEALRRAAIPAYFAHGTSRPEVGGRALLTLLKCAAENLSARRFAEYLSLAQVPMPEPMPETGSAASAEQTAFIAANFETSVSALASDLSAPPTPAASEPLSADPLPVIEGTVRAPWRWERLLADAAVINSASRWERRLKGLEAELKLKRRETKDDEPRAAMIDRQLLDLSHLREIAILIISALADLPRGATWGEWLSALRALVDVAIRDREPVLAALAELEPMAPVGPVDLDEVRLVLGNRLGELRVKPPRRRYGMVFVGPAAAVRGMDFDVAIVPGLSERLFPQKLVEDPLLPDAARERLGSGLATNSDRANDERLALRLAAGAASARFALSYPRIDTDQGRPRVPSFYALEALRAAEGRLPGFDELARRAAEVKDVRLGWPAPHDPLEAIDDAEFDLALLDGLVDAKPDSVIGTANYLLSQNPHLCRALRARGRKWLPRFSYADGLVEPDAAARAALARHQLSARSFSPTALQLFAECPYRFFLQAVHRLEPREEPEAIEMIDPLTRGALFHEVQFELLTALRTLKLLPVTRDNLERALSQVDGILKKVAARFHDELAPAIEKVWDEGIDAIRADLREWLIRAAEEATEWIPQRFELSFGLTDRAQTDPDSAPGAVAIDSGIQLRGSIDLIESRADGVLRATDHKTGKARAEKNVIIGGGRVLQPLLYALAAEKILNAKVEAGRLYYCTAAGGFEERVVPLTNQGRANVATVVNTIGDALSRGFFPAAPDRGVCARCDYRPVCGPYEEQRVEVKLRSQKSQEALAALLDLREMP